MNAIRVLVADDHPLTRTGIREALDHELDMTVVAEAADGEETLRLALQLHPDVLLLDITMPRLNGVEVAKKLRQLAPDIRIVVVSGYEESEYQQDALLRMGVEGYLSKRAMAAEFATGIRAVYDGKRYFRGSHNELQTKLLPNNALTVRELQVLRLAAEGRANREIGDVLCMSEPTVRFHLHNLFTKLHVQRRTQLMSAARQRGLL